MCLCTRALPHRYQVGAAQPRRCCHREYLDSSSPLPRFHHSVYNYKWRHGRQYCKLPALCTVFHLIVAFRSGFHVDWKIFAEMLENLTENCLRLKHLWLLSPLDNAGLGPRPRGSHNTAIDVFSDHISLQFWTFTKTFLANKFQPTVIVDSNWEANWFATCFLYLWLET